MSEEEVRQRAVEGLITKGIIKWEQVVTLFSITLPYGYPIPTVQVKRLIQDQVQMKNGFLRYRETRNWHERMKRWKTMTFTAGADLGDGSTRCPTKTIASFRQSMG